MNFYRQKTKAFEARQIPKADSIEDWHEIIIYINPGNTRVVCDMNGKPQYLLHLDLTTGEDVKLFPGMYVYYIDSIHPRWSQADLFEAQYETTEKVN